VRCYIAGPMTGLKNFNFASFDAARGILEKDGWEVISPADIDRAEGFVTEDEFGNVTQSASFDRKAVLRRDFAELLECDAVFMLSGWENSEGAGLEHDLAVNSGIPVHYDLVFDRFARPDVDWDVDAVGHAEEALAYAREYRETFPEEMASLEADEVTVTDPNTGGKKGQKLARFDLIPAGPLQALAEHYGRGARKYEDRNWEKGYAWSLSFGAMQRHAWSFWNGEDIDEETQSPHLAAVAFHAFALLEFMNSHRKLDDRPRPSDESFFAQVAEAD
jgi:hypothetical protein